MKRNLLTLPAIAAAVLSCLLPAAQAAKPNIAHILTDDLGWMDPACYFRAVRGEASIYETPNMDRLAANGMRFMQAYSPAPTCAPSRAAYISGMYGPKNKVLNVMGGRLARPFHGIHAYAEPFYPSRVSLDMPSLPRVMKQGGYVSAHIQKWHLGGRSNGYPDPVAYGFDFSWEGKSGTPKRGAHVTIGMDCGRLSSLAMKASPPLLPMIRSGPTITMMTDRSTG